MKKCIRLVINKKNLVRFSYAVMFSYFAAGHTHVSHVVHIGHSVCYSWSFHFSLRYFASAMIIFGGTPKHTLRIWSRL